MRTTATWKKYEQSDNTFDDLIAKSTGNISYMLHKSMNALLKVVV